MSFNYITRSGLKLMAENHNDDSFWLKQNENKDSEWARLAKIGHEVYHLMIKAKSGRAQGFAGSIRIDGKVYNYDNARKEFNLL